MWGCPRSQGLEKYSQSQSGGEGGWVLRAGISGATWEGKSWQSAGQWCGGHPECVRECLSVLMSINVKVRWVGSCPFMLVDVWFLSVWEQRVLLHSGLGTPEFSSWPLLGFGHSLWTVDTGALGLEKGKGFAKGQGILRPLI